jgi:hypothetical protein
MNIADLYGQTEQADAIYDVIGILYEDVEEESAPATE